MQIRTDSVPQRTKKASENNLLSFFSFGGVALKSRTVQQSPSSAFFPPLCIQTCIRTHEDRGKEEDIEVEGKKEGG